METIVNAKPAHLLLLLPLMSLPLLTGCSRSPKEQLAYQHAEEQYQINQRNAQAYQQRGEVDGRIDVASGRGRD